MGANVQTRPRVDHILAAIILAIMACITMANILGRYLFHFALAFTEEVTIYLFSALVMLGIGLAFERGAQLGVTTFFKRFPLRMRIGLTWVSGFLTAALLLSIDILLLLTITQEIRLFHTHSPALGMPMWWYYAPLPLLSLFALRGVWRDTSNQLKKQHP